MSTVPPSMPQPDQPPLDELVERLVFSYHSDARTHHLGAMFLPSRAGTIEIVETLRKLIFPGFFDEHRLTQKDVKYHAGQLLIHLRDRLYEQVRQALRNDANRTLGRGTGDHCDHCDQRAAELTQTFLQRLPRIREMLALDIQAAFDGDPAARHTDETIFCYPGIDAIFIHRVAHELHMLEVPLLPRIMSEYAHGETGIDIHPGAQIGRSFFIDHGTGVVIGETTIIGDRVTLYQGVTLGALSLKGGQIWRGRKRHPTLEDDVTIYGGAIILGGETVIGQGCTIGGSVFLTHSIPPYHLVTVKQREYEIRERRRPKGKDSSVDSAML